MLFGVSTVKDTLPHVQRFVAGNLAGGLDHLVVFLDQPGADGQGEVADYLDAHAHVTCVRAGKGWWGESRPQGLNERQSTNAGVVSHLLGEAPDVAWVFHVDGDEVVRLDRAALAAVPQERTAVLLSPREAVSRLSWDREPDLFKIRLDQPDLRLLHQLGVIADSSNRDYFHGHLQGKCGVRPGPNAWLGLHRALTDAGGLVEGFADERLELFHYESYDAEEFIRKWSAMTTSGPRAGFRAGRAALADAVRTLLEKELPPEVRHAQLIRLFERTTMDDVQTLTDLALVLKTDPLAGGHRPAALSPEAATVVGERIDALRGVDKSAYFRGSSPRAEDGAAKGKSKKRNGARAALLRRPT